jgi:hypothetical protein
LKHIQDISVALSPPFGDIRDISVALSPPFGAHSGYFFCVISAVWKTFGIFLLPYLHRLEHIRDISVALSPPVDRLPWEMFVVLIATHATLDRSVVP